MSSEEKPTRVLSREVHEYHAIERFCIDNRPIILQNPEGGWIIQYQRPNKDIVELVRSEEPLFFCLKMATDVFPMKA